MRGPPHTSFIAMLGKGERFLVNFISETFKIHITASQQLIWGWKKALNSSEKENLVQCLFSAQTGSRVESEGSPGSVD